MQQNLSWKAFKVLWMTPFPKHLRFRCGREGSQPTCHHHKPDCLSPKDLNWTWRTCSTRNRNDFHMMGKDIIHHSHVGGDCTWYARCQEKLELHHRWWCCSWTHPHQNETEYHGVTRADLVIWISSNLELIGRVNTDKIIDKTLYAMAGLWSNGATHNSGIINSPFCCCSRLDLQLHV